MTSWPTIPEEIKVWLSDWEAEVQDMRFDEASRRFHPQTCAFGTVMHAGQDLQSLICDQWQVVWPRTRNFRFHMDSARAWGDAEHHVVAVQWSGEGIEAWSGQAYLRTGRATIVLMRQQDRWIGVHTHLSISPTPERFLSAQAPRSTPEPDSAKGLC